MPNIQPHGLSHHPLSGDPVPGVPWDPQNGLYLYDDFNYKTTAAFLAAGYDGAGNSSGGVGVLPTLLLSDIYSRSQGAVELNTGTSQANANQGYAFSRGIFSPNGGYTLGFGVCDIKSRICIENPSIQAGGGFLFRFGFWNGSTNISGGSWFGTNATQGACLLEWSPDQNGGLMRIGYKTIGANSALTYVNCTGNAVPNFGRYDWWELQIDASLNVTALLNGVVIGTAAGVAPAAPYSQLPHWMITRNTTYSTLYYAAIDDFYMLYKYAR